MHERKHQTDENPGITCALDVVEQLREEVRLSEYLARREQERRQKDRRQIRVAPSSEDKKQSKPRRRAKSTPPS